MNKYSLTLVWILIVFNNAHAESLWAASISGKGRDTVSSVSANHEFVCLSGNSQGGSLLYSGISMNKDNPIDKVKTEVRERSAILACQNMQGKLISLKAFHGDGLVQINDLAITPTGEIYLVGFFANHFSVPTSLVAKDEATQSVTGEGGVDGFVIKYDANKSLQWVKTLTNQTGIQAWQLSAREGQSGVIVQGTFHGEVKLPDGQLIKGDAPKNHFLLSLDGSGHTDWHQQWLAKNGKILAGGLVYDGNGIYETFAHELPIQKSNKSTHVMVIKRDVDNGDVKWQKQFKVSGSGFVTKPVMAQSQLSFGISFQNTLTHNDFETGLVSSGQTDGVLMILNEQDGKVLDHYQFGDSGAEAVVELSNDAKNKGLIFSYYQILPDERKVKYNTSLYDTLSHKHKPVLNADLLSRDYSIQSQVMVDNKLITVGVVFKKKAMKYEDQNKIVSSKKSDIYINLYTPD